MICLENILKISLQYVLKMSWRFLEDVLKTFWKRLEDVWKLLEDVLKTSSKRLKDVFARSLEDVFENVWKKSWQDVLKTSWKRLEDVLKTYGQDEYIGLDQDVLKTSSEEVRLRRAYSSWRRPRRTKTKDVFKTYSRRFHQDECLLGDNRKVPKSFQSQGYLGNSNNKTNLVKYLYQKWRETLPNVLASSQTIDLANLDGATDKVVQQTKVVKELIFVATTKKLTQKCLRMYIKFLCNNIRLKRVIIVSRDTDAVVISLYQNGTNLTFSDTIWFKTDIGDNQKYIPIQILASE